MEKKIEVLVKNVDGVQKAEEVEIKDREIARPPRINQSLILPISILAAAVLIAGAIIYTRKGGDGQKQGAPVANVNLKIDDSDPVLGNKNAKVTIVEFADFRCPFCEKFFKETEPGLLSDYINTGKAKFVFKNYAFLGQESTWASEAAACAAEQSKFWEYHNWLYANQAPENNLAYYSKANLVKYASKIDGINTAQFTSCLNADKYSKRVTDDLTQGQSLGVSGTPTALVMVNNNTKFDVAYINSQLQLNKFIIPLSNGNFFVVGAQPLDVFKRILDAALK